MKKNIRTSIFCILSLAAFTSLKADESQAKPPHHHQCPVCPLQYGSFYTKNDLYIPPNHAIPFEHKTVCPTHGIELLVDTGDILLKEPGIYRVIYSVALKEKGGRVALSLNNHVVPGSEMYVDCDGDLHTLALLVKVCNKSCCDNILRVINNQPIKHGWYTNDIILGSHCEAVTASIEIERVAHCTPCGCECK